MALSPLAVFLQESSNTNDFFRNLAIQQELKDEWVLLDREIWQVLLHGQTLQETPEKKLCVWSKGTRCQDQDLVCCQYEFIHASDHIRAGPGNGRTR
ncbi:hypothetical protein quinque_004602 [Culex quinquefasciatus]